jgi:putative membrane protein
MLSIILLNIAAVGITVGLIPRLYVTSITGVFALAVALAIVNATIWDPKLFAYIPTEFSNRALILVLVNGLLFWILAKLLPGIKTEGFVPSLLAPIVLTIITGLVHQYGRDHDPVQVSAKAVKVVADEIKTLRGRLLEPTENDDNRSTEVGPESDQRLPASSN